MGEKELWLWHRFQKGELHTSVFSPSHLTEHPRPTSLPLPLPQTNWFARVRSWRALRAPPFLYTKHCRENTVTLVQQREREKEREREIWPDQTPNSTGLQRSYWFRGPQHQHAHTNTYTCTHARTNEYGHTVSHTLMQTSTHTHIHPSVPSCPQPSLLVPLSLSG